MDIHPIRSDEDHSAALKLIERFWDAPDGSEEADTLDVLAVLVDDYESTRWPIEPLDPVETIKRIWLRPVGARPTWHSWSVLALEHPR